MRLSAVLVVDTRPTSVETAVEGLAVAVDRAERAGADVHVVIVNASLDPLVAEFLRKVDGAQVLLAPGAPRPAALLLGARAATAPIVWLSGSEAVASADALIRLSAAVADGAALALAGGDDPAPFCALSSASVPALERLVESSAEDLDVVAALGSALLAEGLEVVCIRGAGSHRYLQRETRPIDGGTRLSVVPGTFTVGPASYSGPNSLFRTYSALDSIDVGGYCSIADEVRLVLPGGRVFDAQGHEQDLVQRGEHRTDSASSFPIGILVPDEIYDQPPPGSFGERLVVGDDVWIGYRASVVGSVTVGTGAVVASGAVVVKDVPPYAVVGGVPATVIRMRFDEQTVDRLSRVRWWQWPPATVQGAHRWFTRPVADFLRHFDPAGEAGLASARRDDAGKRSPERRNAQPR